MIFQISSIKSQILETQIIILCQFLQISEKLQNIPDLSANPIVLISFCYQPIQYELSNSVKIQKITKTYRIYQKYPILFILSNFLHERKICNSLFVKNEKDIFAYTKIQRCHVLKKWCQNKFYQIENSPLCQAHFTI